MQIGSGSDRRVNIYEPDLEVDVRGVVLELLQLGQRGFDAFRHHRVQRKVFVEKAFARKPTAFEHVKVTVVLNFPA